MIILLLLYGIVNSLWKFLQLSHIENFIERRCLLWQKIQQQWILNSWHRISVVVLQSVANWYALKVFHIERFGNRLVFDTPMIELWIKQSYSKEGFHYVCK